jgi:hypothetical protein
MPSNTRVNFIWLIPIGRFIVRGGSHCLVEKCYLGSQERSRAPDVAHADAEIVVVAQPDFPGSPSIRIVSKP